LRTLLESVVGAAPWAGPHQAAPAASGSLPVPTRDRGQSGEQPCAAGTAFRPRSAADLGVQPGLEPYYRLPVESVASRLETDTDRGLSASQAARRAGRYGRNEVPDIPRRPRSALVKEQLSSVPSLMLLAAGGFSMVTGAVTDAVFIGGAVVANAVIGYLTEDSAERSIQSLRQ